MEKLLELIDKKIEEIESYAIDTQENEERYIHEINCLNRNQVLALWRQESSSFLRKMKKGVDRAYGICHTSIIL